MKIKIVCIYVYLNDDFIQLEVSSSRWPSVASWGKVAEKYNIVYKGQNFSYMDSINFDLARSRGVNPTDSKLMDIGPAVKEHIVENYLQVKSSHLLV